MGSKGQFMMISAVVVGVIVISVAGTISEVQNQQFSNSDAAYQVQSIEEEAGEIDLTRPENRKKFREMIEQLPYRTETVYWESQQCFNLTLSRTDQRIRLECIS